jgi:hypothetical protein
MDCRDDNIIIIIRNLKCLKIFHEFLDYFSFIWDWDFLST